MNFEESLKAAEVKLCELGLPFWSNKLSSIRASNSSQMEKAEEVIKLYGGFGTLNDHAFESEEKTKEYFHVINYLYAAAKSLSA